MLCKNDRDVVWDMDSLSPRNYVFDGGPDPSQDRALLGERIWACIGVSTVAYSTYSTLFARTELLRYIIGPQTTVADRSFFKYRNMISKARIEYSGPRTDKIFNDAALTRRCSTVVDIAKSSCFNDGHCQSLGAWQISHRKHQVSVRVVLQPADFHSTALHHSKRYQLDDAVASYSQELKEMLPEGFLSIAIKADFWQPQKNERKAELIKY